MWVSTTIADYEEGYSAYREEQWGKMTRPKSTPPYTDTDFQLKQQWIELSDERKFFWWWKAKYAMGASKKDKEWMQEYMQKYFILGTRKDDAPSYETFRDDRKKQKNSSKPPAVENLPLSSPKTKDTQRKPTGVFTETGAIPSEGLNGRYLSKLYLAIGSRWNLRVQQETQKIEPGYIIIEFHIETNGQINNINIIKGKKSSKLAEISADAIRLSSGLIGPFPEDTLKENPDGITWKLSFQFE